MSLFQLKFQIARKQTWLSITEKNLKKNSIYHVSHEKILLDSWSIFGILFQGVIHPPTIFKADEVENPGHN